jgi:NitT/TauT family transport system permease protein
VGTRTHAPPRALRRDAAAAIVVLGSLVAIGIGARKMAMPLASAYPPAISLSPWALPEYTLRTVTRMLAALIASLLFTFTYGTWAAKSPRAERVLIPVLDVLQSVPVLGYLSFTAVFFVSLSPGNELGAEFAAIFAIFTSQAWNMAFSFYQSLKTVPTDLDEASRSLRASGWQRFWRLDVPFAMPGLVWNTMMSMSGGWFFVVASEAISVGSTQIVLPGVGSYVARAIEEHDLTAVGYAVAAMTGAIILYDQLLFRPLVAWGDRFRFEQIAGREVPRSWVLDVLSGSRLVAMASRPLGRSLERVTRARLELPQSLSRIGARVSVPDSLLRLLWYGVAVGVGALAAWKLLRSARSVLALSDLASVTANGAITLLRVVVLTALASLVWVPVGVTVGLRPTWTARVQPLAQFLAAFPANLLFPFAVFLILRFRLSPAIWLSGLMILGTQWYILFNVIAGASAYPSDLREAAESLRVRPRRWWRDIVLPGIFPYYVTGAITAAGGAWNASIVSETVNWGTTRVSGSGLGAYIAERTLAGDYPRIALGVAAMSLIVIAMNVLLWQPLYRFAERRMRLD